MKNDNFEDTSKYLSRQSIGKRSNTNSGRLKYFLKIGAVIIFAILILEGGLRLREKLRSKIGGVYPGLTYQHHQLRHAFIPNTTYFNRVKINSLGFRSPEITIQKPPNTIRIVCIGGSTTFDTYVSSNDRTWTNKLKRFLKEKYLDANIEVINAGVVGYKVMDSLINLQSRILPLEPDMIVFYHAHNDIAGNRNTYLPTKEVPRPGEVKNECAIIGFLREHSLLYQKTNLLIRYIIAGRRSKHSSRHDTISKVGLSNFEKTLSLIGFVCAENNIKLIMPYVITGFREEMSKKEQLENAKWSVHFSRHLSLNGIYDGYSKYNQVIKKIASRFNGIFVYSTSEIPGGSDYFADGLHFTDKGAERFAEIVGSKILETGLLQEVISSNIYISKQE